MTVPDPQRRRFLVYLGALTGLGLVSSACDGLASTRTSSLRPSPTVDPTPPTTAHATNPTAAMRPTEAAPTTSSTVLTSRLQVLCRDSWGADPASDGMERHEIVRLTVHHTANPTGDPTAAPGRIRAYQRYHMRDQRWPDIAYHYLIDAAGNIYEGRDPAYRGDTATEYDPTGHFLVCLDGHYDHEAPTDVQMSAAIDLLAHASMRYGVDPSTLGGHRDYAATTCPGENVSMRIADGSLEAEVRRRLDASTIDLDIVCGEPAAAIIAAIEAGKSG